MENYYTVSEYAKLTGKDPGQIRRMLIYGRLIGEKLGKQWIIPKEAEYPEDQRVKSGEYRNWRKKYDVRSDNPALFKLLNKMCKSLSVIYGDNLEKIILYGSYARGEQTEESDADIAIILKSEVPETAHDRMVDTVIDYELECGITISVVQLNGGQYDKWKSTLPYYKNIEKEGIILWKAA